MDRAALSTLARSFERHLRAENRSATTITTYLAADAFLTARNVTLAAAAPTWRPS
jgi:hypothetical protein